MEQEQNITKKRKWKQLSEKERYKIEALSQQGLTPAEIGDALNPKRDRRTIERELKRGMTQQMRMNTSNSKSVSEEMYITFETYLADVGQRKREENASNKGRGLKIGHDHNLARYLEQKIGEEKWSPDAAIGAIKAAKCNEVYYAHPYSSWERGSNENGNRILRRFLPKGTDFGKLSHSELQRIENRVNNYPRRIHGYKSANQVAS